MCYIITGTMDKSSLQNPEVIAAFKAFNRKHVPIINHSINQQVNPSGQRAYFRYTNKACDCLTCLGQGDPDTEGIHHWIKFFQSLGRIKNLNFAGLLKHWHSRSPESEKITITAVVSIHVDELTGNFLANLQKDIYYQILLAPQQKKKRACR